MNEKEENKKSLRAEAEERVLSMWNSNNIFKKTIEKDALHGDFIVFEGPPTANGKPGIHHLEARAFKDAIPRYKTMKGYRVKRKGGWDTHGLPVELQVEKALGLMSKKHIEEYGVEAFNKKCKDSVWEYKSLWEKFTNRMGYWTDLENAYVTYHNSYIEAVWGVLKKADSQKLVYKDYRITPWCARCGTALSSHEIAQGYKDVRDLSVYAKFKITNSETMFPNVTGTIFAIAWTTTPWTLLGNVALAVGSNIQYDLVQVRGDNLNYYIVAHELVGSIFDTGYEVCDTKVGSELVGLLYEPLYLYQKEEMTRLMDTAIDKAWKIYNADFVTTTDGTGIVHTAVMYGADDFVLGTLLDLPKLHIIDDEGRYRDFCGVWSNRFVKEKNDAGEETLAIDIIKDLAGRGLLFKKEKYEHSYPHCWRCDTPLLYFARDSWYIRMSEIKQNLIDGNKHINWEPSYIKEGRFGEWLKDLKDWAISRERYWGTPLPIWIRKDGTFKVMGSIKEILSHTKKPSNQYFTMRHGEAESNILGNVSSLASNDDPLTAFGVSQVKESTKNLGFTPDVILYSPFLRTKQTALLVKQELSFEGEYCEVDLLGEIGALSMDGETWNEYDEHRNGIEPRGEFFAKLNGDESLFEAGKRILGLIKDLEHKYQDKKILLITHGSPIYLLELFSNYLDTDKIHHHFNRGDYRPKNAEVREIVYKNYPRDKDGFFDVHKPFIDDIELFDENGEIMMRTKEVMDVWFDSGAMPYAQNHILDEDVDVPDAYPADFISEAIDQTRGWFYTLHAIASIIGQQRAFKNVICLGLVMDKDGKKMSKSKGNIIDPLMLCDKWGADALRFFMYSINQPGETKFFDEKKVDEINKKVINTLLNSNTFYNEFKTGRGKYIFNSSNILDIWIMSRFSKLEKTVTEHMDAYKLMESTRAIRVFIDELSTWFIRRSRDRMKSEGEDAILATNTLYTVLKSISIILAPFMPFFADELWNTMRIESDEISVHLSDWNTIINFKINEQVETEMTKARNFISLGLKQRQDAKIKVRQPLASVSIGHEFSEAFKEIIMDELNVKQVVANSTDDFVQLDTIITDELIKEGEARDLIRVIQDYRKECGFISKDRAVLYISKSLNAVTEFKDMIFKIAGIIEVVVGECDNTKEVQVGDFVVVVGLAKV